MTVADRLQLLNPAEDVATVFHGLRNGDGLDGEIRLIERFNLRRADAQMIRERVQAGEDAERVLDAWLNNVGITETVAVLSNLTSVPWETPAKAIPLADIQAIRGLAHGKPFIPSIKAHIKE